MGICPSEVQDMLLTEDVLLQKGCGFPGSLYL